MIDAKGHREEGHGQVAEARLDEHAEVVVAAHRLAELPGRA